MIDCIWKMLQLNCQKSYKVMCDLGVIMSDEKINIALLQEPYVSNGRVCGLPCDMRVISCGVNAKTAVVVNDYSMEIVAVDECVSEHGVCVWIKNMCGVFYVCSVYCQYSLSIEPMIQYMEGVLNVISGEPMIFGIDANAVSPMHSKYVNDSRVAEERGVKVEDFLLFNDLCVLNEPTEIYTFSGPRSESDIDVTVVNDGWLKKFINFVFRWIFQAFYIIIFFTLVYKLRKMYSLFHVGPY